MLRELIIDEITTYIRVGIDASEQHSAQRLLVSARIWADYPAHPRDISECVNYGLLDELVTHEWPKRSHVDLLETLEVELYQHIFSASDYIEKVAVQITKPDIFENAKQVGIFSQLTRQQFAAL